jgi:hypothetical protein
VGQHGDGMEEDEDEAATWVCCTRGDDEDRGGGDAGGTGAAEGATDRASDARTPGVYLPATEVLPWLFLSGKGPSQDADALERMGITCVVNCAADVCPNVFEASPAASVAPIPWDLTYVTLYLLDSNGQDMFALFARIVDVISTVQRTGGRVLVHCHQGISRSATFVLAYLMWSARLRFQPALEYLRLLRRIVCPNAAFMCQLLEWEKHLNGLRRDALVPATPSGPAVFRLVQLPRPFRMSGRLVQALVGDCSACPDSLLPFIPAAAHPQESQESDRCQCAPVPRHLPTGQPATEGATCRRCCNLPEGSTQGTCLRCAASVGFSDDMCLPKLCPACRSACSVTTGEEAGETAATAPPTSISSSGGSKRCMQVGNSWKWRFVLEVCRNPTDRSLVLPTPQFLQAEAQSTLVCIQEDFAALPERVESQLSSGNGDLHACLWIGRHGANRRLWSAMRSVCDGDKMINIPCFADVSSPFSFIVSELSAWTRIMSPSSSMSALVRSHMHACLSRHCPTDADMATKSQSQCSRAYCCENIKAALSEPLIISPSLSPPETLLHGPFLQASDCSGQECMPFLGIPVHAVPSTS